MRILEEYAILDLDEYKKRETKMGKFNLRSVSGTKYEVTLENGVVLSGTQKELIKILNNLGYDVENLKTYRSQSQGSEILISSMATAHIRNAMQKRIREWAEFSLPLLTPQQFSDIASYLLYEIGDEFDDLAVEFMNRVDSESN